MQSRRAVSFVILALALTSATSCRTRQKASSYVQSADTASLQDMLGFGLKDEAGTFDIQGQPIPYKAAVITSIAPGTIAAKSGLKVGDRLHALKWDSTAGVYHFYRMNSTSDYQQIVSLIAVDQVKKLTVYGASKESNGNDSRGSFPLANYKSTVTEQRPAGRCVSVTAAPIGVGCDCSINATRLTSCRNVQTADECETGSHAENPGNPFSSQVKVFLEKDLPCGA